MCEKLAELEEAMGVFTADFEPALVSGAQAEGVMERAARIEHMAATLKALAAARMAETELWRMGGDRSPPTCSGARAASRCRRPSANWTTPSASRNTPRPTPRLGPAPW